MQIVSDNLHEMSKPVFWGKKSVHVCCLLKILLRSVLALEIKHNDIHYFTENNKHITKTTTKQHAFQPCRPKNEILFKQYRSLQAVKLGYTLFSVFSPVYYDIFPENESFYVNGLVWKSCIKMNFKPCFLAK